VTGVNSCAIRQGKYIKLAKVDLVKHKVLRLLLKLKPPVKRKKLKKKLKRNARNTKLKRLRSQDINGWGTNDKPDGIKVL
jgi:hypothetical protein